MRMDAMTSDTRDKTAIGGNEDSSFREGYSKIKRVVNPVFQLESQYMSGATVVARRKKLDRDGLNGGERPFCAICR